MNAWCLKWCPVGGRIVATPMSRLCGSHSFFYITPLYLGSWCHARLAARLMEHRSAWLVRPGGRKPAPWGNVIRVRHRFVPVGAASVGVTSLCLLGWVGVRCGARTFPLFYFLASFVCSIIGSDTCVREEHSSVSM
jgi:hypothetical protein